VYLGMDIGTSSVKAVLVDGAGALVAQASAALPIDRPQLG
jgi:xylulokinase